MANDKKEISYDYGKEINQDNRGNIEHLKDQLSKWVASEPSDTRTRQIEEIESEIDYLIRLN